MDFSESQLNWAAILFELGVPVATIVAAVCVPKLRKFAVVVLGALTLPLVVYGWVTVAYCLNPSDRENIFGFYAMWIMSFFVYLTLLLGGVALSFIPRPTNLYLRFSLGFASVPLAYFLLKVIS